MYISEVYKTLCIIFIYGKFNSNYYVFLYNFFLVCKLYKCGLQIMHPILDNFRLMESVGIRDHLVAGCLERSVLTFNYFFNIFFLA